MTDKIIPERYLLVEVAGRLNLYLYFNGGKRTCIESVPNVTGKSLPYLRREGVKLAKRNSVTFVDNTI